MRLDLTGDQRQRLLGALKASYDQLTLDAMLSEQLGRRLDSAVALPQPWDTLPTNLLKRAYMQSWTDDLVLAASAYRPEEKELSRLIVELGLSAAGPGRLSVSPSVLLKGPEFSSLEGLVRRSSPLSNVETFIAALTQLQYQVCRIEASDMVPARALGTGFLVGDDLVLTNWHVSELIKAAGGSVYCRFDYRADASGIKVSDGFTVGLVSQWLLGGRPYADSDITAGGAPPAATDLDYALIRIAKPVGRYAVGKDGTIAGAAERGFLKLQNPKLLDVGSELFVLQHPSGQPMKLAVGQVVERAPDPDAPLRLRHDSTTEGGSSGSPCFDAELQLIALHHATDPQNPLRPKYNQAIPIGLIGTDVRALGIYPS